MLGVIIFIEALYHARGKEIKGPAPKNEASI